MAGSDVKAVRTEHALSVAEMLRVEFNKLIDDVEALRAEVEAETTSVIAAGDLTAGKVTLR